MNLESKEYAWKHITTDELLCKGPCELIDAALAAGAANNYVILYNGNNTTGTQIVKLHAQTRTLTKFQPKVPVYCRHGLYADLSDNVDGVFVQWRELGPKAGG